MLGAIVASDDRKNRSDDDDGRVYLTRKSAAAYLSRKLDRPVSAGSMQRWASQGWGPRYEIIVGRASYTKAWLDEWLASPNARRKHGGYRPRKSD